MSYPNIQLNIVDAIDSPALLIFPKIIAQNIATAQSMVSASRNCSLRPHVKTVKCLEIIKMAIGAGIRKFKCSTIAEAELLGMAMAKDVLLNYQLSGVKAKRFKELIIAYPDTKFSCLIDNIKSAHLLSKVFDENVYVYIDVNLGMDRTGIHPEEALDLLLDVQSLGNIRVIGFHAYEGHIHSSNIDIRRSEAKAAYQQMKMLKNAALNLIQKEFSLVLGGSPSFTYYASQENLECSPGTFFLWDFGYGSSYPEIPFKVAAILLTRVVSIIDNKQLCLDLGYKSVASDQPLPRVIFPEIEEYTVLDQFEEHMVVQVPDTSIYQIGTPWVGVPYHICPTVNLYEKITTIEDGEISNIWKIEARDKQITI